MASTIETGATRADCDFDAGFAMNDTLKAMLTAVVIANLNLMVGPWVLLFGRRFGS